jgi:DNA-binding response OmpR family regulator
MPERVLIVSDEQQHSAMRESLAQQGYFVTLTDDADRAFSELLTSQCAIVIVRLDHSIDRLDLIKRIRQNAELQRISILAVGEWGTGQPTMALAAGADGFEPEPVNRERLIAAVAKLMRPNLTMIASASGVDREKE